MNAADSRPGFAFAALAVIAAGFVTSIAANALVGFTPYFGPAAWTFVTSLIGGFVLRGVMRVVGFHVSYVAAVAALIVGSLVSLALSRMIHIGTSPAAPFIPAYGIVLSIPSLFLAALIVQMSASRPSANRPS